MTSDRLEEVVDRLGGGALRLERVLPVVLGFFAAAGKHGGNEHEHCDGEGDTSTSGAA